VAENNSDENKTEPASPRKRQDARRMGMFANSMDLTTAVLLIVGILSMAGLGATLVDSLLGFMHGWFVQLSSTKPLNDLILEQLPSAIEPVAWVVVGIAALAASATLTIGLWQSSLLFSPELLAFKWERLDIVQGFKRIFSADAMVGTVIGVFKLVIIGWASYHVLCTIATSAACWWRYPVQGLLPLGGEFVLRLGWTAAIPLLLLAAGDYAFKKWRFERNLMMSREEVRQEARSHDQAPELKARIRGIQRQRAMQRMMQAVPQASVVITNPTHVAVALRYAPGETTAPVVVAKGQRKIAERIKAIAAEHGVPIMEEPPLARAMFKVAQVGQEIPFEFYRAVAQILALLYRRRQGVPQAARAGSYA